MINDNSTKYTKVQKKTYHFFFLIPNGNLEYFRVIQKIAVRIHRKICRYFAWLALMQQ